MECRDSLGLFNQSLFSLWTCSLCYTYLFPNDVLRFNFDKTKPGLSKDMVTSYHPHVEEPESFEEICNTIDPYKCEKWKQCCRAATKCCDQQIRTPYFMKNRTETSFCPRTWDGWSCFNDTLAGTRVEKACPGFLLYGDLEGTATKECTVNGTWARHHVDNKEWTDYSKCVDIKGKKAIVYAGLLASSLSLLLLIPAVTIFLVYRQLRSQQRIQLHVCLLISFVLFSMIKLIWIVFVYNDRIDNQWQDTFMVRNECVKTWSETFILVTRAFRCVNTSETFILVARAITGACKVVYVLKRYARCTNYFWMFCEGLFLYRLLVHAFNSPKHIKPYLIIAWGLPLLPVFVYSMVRGFLANDVCWVKNAGGLEWILYTPNLLCIMMNLFFLLKILNILLTQLHQHPNEPNNYRRALRATFVLVPLFGLQLFLVVYRPSDPVVQDVYEIIATVITDFQGGIIALVFCYFNGEVIHCIKTSVDRLRRSKRLPSFATYYSEVTQKVDGDKSKNHSKTLKTDLMPMKDLPTRNGVVADDNLLDV